MGQIRIPRVRRADRRVELDLRTPSGAALPF